MKTSAEKKNTGVPVRGDAQRGSKGDSLSNKKVSPIPVKQVKHKTRKQSARPLTHVTTGGKGKSTAARTAVSYDKDRIDRNLITVLKPYSFETEMFKVLRAKILHPLSGMPPRSILVTSAVPGEGKSFVAANLAVTIAQYIQEYVLLMDCDLRKPCIHTRFGFPPVQGLSEYLSTEIDLPPLLLKTMLKKLTILPGGRPPYNPSELLSSSKMRSLMEEMQERYEDRYLVVDSPPPALAPETLAIAEQVDGILLVVKHKSTPQELVAELAKDFDEDKIIGAVINRFDMRSSKYYGYGKYRQYKKYYSYPK